MNGCSNGSVSLFKAMLQWLANCSVKDNSFQNYSQFSPRGPTPSKLHTRFQITVIFDLISDF